MNNIYQDLRHNLRMLARNPGFTFIIVFTLALGIGASTALFSVVSNVALRPLPFHEPDRLLGLRETFTGEGTIPIAYRTFAEWRDRNTVFENITAMSAWNPDIEAGSEPARVSGMRVSASYFQVMGLEPVLGRGFLPEEDRPGGERVVVLGHDLWQQFFGGDRNAIGRTMMVNGRSYEVVGVMPPALQHQDIGWMNIWTPLAIDDQKERANRGRYLRAVARLKAGVTIEQARSELEFIMNALKQEFPDTHNDGYGVDARPLMSFVVKPNTQSAIWMLFEAVGFLLLIACANAANMLLARAVTREKEIAVRTAVGASRPRLIRQLLIESVTLSLLGGVVGLLMALNLLDLLIALAPENIPRLDEVSINLPVLGFSILLAVVTGILSGLVPAFIATRVNLNEMLKESGRTSGEGLRQSRLRNLLVVSEIALALVLLIGSGLMIKSYVRLRGIEPGFDTSRVLTMAVRLPQVRYPENHQRVNYYRRTLERLAALPGIENVAAVQSLLLKDGVYTDPVYIEGQPIPDKGEELLMRQNVVTSDYFRAMGMRLIEGRYFTEQENWETGGVIIVNESFARKFWPGETPIGKRMKAGYNAEWSTVIGIVGDTVQPGIQNGTIEEMFYPYVNTADPPLRAMNILMRTEGDPTALAATAREEIAKLDRSLPVTDLATLEQLSDRAVDGPRFNLLLLSLFSVVGLILAAMGIYGVMSYAAARRAREMGIRMALGAQPRDVFKIVIGKGMALALAGTLTGLAAAFALTRLMESLLFDVSATDRFIFFVVSLLLPAVALIACYVPARRAAKVDPIDALRYE